MNFFIIKGSYSAFVALILIIIVISTPVYIIHLEETGVLPRMLVHRPNTFNKIKKETRMSKNRMIKNNCPPGDFKGADVRGISSMIWLHGYMMIW